MASRDASGVRRSSPNLRRRPPIKDPKRKIIVFSEGKNTENVYLHALVHHYGNQVLLDFHGPVGVPNTIAKHAVEEIKYLRKSSNRKKKIDSFEEKDEVWAVFDRDQHDLVPESIRKCRDNGVFVAYSNPCFEVWLILHVQPYDKPDDRHLVMEQLRKLCPEYDPNGSKTLDCARAFYVCTIAGFAEASSV